MLAANVVCEKNEGNGNGDSILSGFGSSSGSSTDETFEQEEFLDELSRKMAEHMLQEEDEGKVANKHKATRVESNNVFQYQRYGEDKEVKENKYGSTKAGFRGGAAPNGSGLRLLYLGSRNGSGGGTGVFIPHATNTQPDHQPRKKPGRCARVLIPERVLHSLKQHHEKRNADQTRPIAVFQAHQTQMRLQHQDTPNKAVVNNNKNENNDDDNDELQLPREWTY
ncbi:hypothetical protein POM88_013299 [Heracleum sosnowskyi]|uniref:Uncharacterized protein n=1 Tax=Heracleum sosnowskyi TaxID=360622 RepID=A0AAD8J0A8_9APIA|nr:hypothetical protein POM88_013299 [Heracleum sosnowskyi]